jgi:hypothetical protein
MNSLEFFRDNKEPDSTKGWMHVRGTSVAEPPKYIMSFETNNFTNPKIEGGWQHYVWWSHDSGKMKPRNNGGALTNQRVWWPPPIFSFLSNTKLTSWTIITGIILSCLSCLSTSLSDDKLTDGCISALFALLFRRSHCELPLPSFLPSRLCHPSLLAIFHPSFKQTIKRHRYMSWPFIRHASRDLIHCNITARCLTFPFYVFIETA